MKLYLINAEQVKQLESANTNEYVWIPTSRSEFSGNYINEYLLSDPLFSKHKEIFDTFVDVPTFEISGSI